MRRGVALSRQRRRAAIGAVVAFVLGAAATTAGAAGGSGRVPVPQPSVERGTQCIAPAAEMRRTHMDLLRHQRDRTLRDGVRGAKVSLNGCIDCHATPVGAAGTRSVVGSADAFCQGCHQYAGVTLDCFECHQPKAAARPGAAGRSGR